MQTWPNFGYTVAYVGGGGGAITPSVTVSRNSGKEMLAVYFDASGTTASTTSNPEHELFYAWDFGDERGQTWAYGTNTAQSKNNAFGPQAAHVYTTAGTFTPTCVILDGSGNTTTWTGSSITVSAWTETETIYIANGSTPTAGANGVGSGAAGYHNETTWAGVVSRFAPGKRVRLRAGDTWTATATASINNAATFQIDTYGSGANAVINSTSTTGWANVLEATGTTSDARIKSLTFTRTVADIEHHCLSGGYCQNFLVHSCDISGNYSGVLMGLAPSTITAGFFLVDSNIHDIGVGNTPATNVTYWGMYLESIEKSAILGSRIHNNATSHCVRIPGLRIGVIANSDIGDARHGGWSAGGNILTIRGFNDPGGNLAVFSGNYVEKIVIRDNYLYSNYDNVYLLQTAAQNTGDVSRHRNIIVEGNYFYSSATTTGYSNEASNVTIRNNIFNLNQSVWSVCMNGQNDYAGGNQPNDVRVYNNTIYKYGTNQTGNGGHTVFLLTALNSWNTCTNIVIKNNLAYAPNTTQNFNQAQSYPTMVETSGSGTFSYTFDVPSNSTNTQLKNTKPWAAATPATYADYAPNGYGLNTGVSVPVIKDFFNTTITGTREMGAIQA